MRIRGSGKDTGGFGGGWSRSDSFKRKHRLGQKVRGILLKNVADNMAWVEINGDRLLAQLEITHPEGSRLIFVIKQLTPHIILKELSGRQSGTTGTLGLVKGFDTARTLFEGRFRPTFKKAQPTEMPLSFIGFMTLVVRDSDLHARYRDAANCAKVLSVSLGDDNSRFLYQPWLAPDSRRQVTFIRSNPTSGLTETIVEFDHSKMGLIRTDFLGKDSQTICKLKVQNMAHGKQLLRYLSSRKHPELDVEIENIGLSKLSQRNHGGIIAELLFKQ